MTLLSLSTSVLLLQKIHVFVNMLQMCVFISIAECDRTVVAVVFFTK